MTSHLDKFVKLMHELFQLDQPDLDFGIYRILNQRRDVVLEFIDKTLPAQVKQYLREATSAEADGARKAKQAELDKTIASLRDAGVDPEQAPKVASLRKELTAFSVADPAALESEIFSHLFTFFRRYYSEGDFLSLRRYKEGTYAVPYEGEEVHLHWANKDQYYVKTTEQFRNYTFRLSQREGDARRVHFRLVDASTEGDNNKAASGKERRFILCETDPFVAESADSFVCRFEYRADPDKRKQDPLNDVALERLKSAPAALSAWTDELLRVERRANGDSWAVFEKHLDRYTKRNTFDYFIHKDLGGFLRRELDFYLKNEVMHLDDLDRAETPAVESYLAKLKTLRRIAHKIIAFLAQIEDFQKKLWLKKKFVLETHYCVTLDLVPEDLYPVIVANEPQAREWAPLLARAMHSSSGEPDSLHAQMDWAELVKAFPRLLVDSRHFSPEMRRRIAAIAFARKDKWAGTLSKSDNFHALRHWGRRFRGTVPLVYIDPPYNSKTSEIVYKNSYKHSSWLSLMRDRLAEAARLLAPDGNIVVAIDENEQDRLSLMLRQMFPGHEITCVSVVHNPRGIQGDGFSYTHEYAVFMTRLGAKLPLRRLSEEKEKPLMKTGGESKREDGPNMFFPIFVRNGRVVGIGSVPEDSFHPPRHQTTNAEGATEVWPIDSDGGERKWRYIAKSLAPIVDQLLVKNSRDGGLAIYLSKDEESFRTVWTDPKYNAAEYGSSLLKRMGLAGFSFPKSLHTVRDCVEIGLCGRSGWVVDFFAGSGTTAHAVFDMRDHADVDVRFALSEMGEHFDSVTLPRVKRAAMSGDWSDGTPVRWRQSGSAFSYQVFESYDDAMNSLTLAPMPIDAAALTPDAREAFTLGYMLDFESRGSLLNLQGFVRPDGYQIEVERDGVRKKVTVDLVETFNWLLGLEVEHMDEIDGVQTIEGKDPGGTNVLVIWRDVEKTDHAALDAWFRKARFSVRDSEFGVIYVNGDNTLENIRREDESWKVRLTEEWFQKLMFEVDEA